MSRYAVFAFDQYYPSGGFRDLIGRDIESLEEARASAKRERFLNDNSGWDLWQIVEMETWKVVEVGGVLGELYSEDLMNSEARDPRD